MGGIHLELFISLCFVHLPLIVIELRSAQVRSSSAHYIPMLLLHLLLLQLRKPENYCLIISHNRAEDPTNIIR